MIYSSNVRSCTSHGAMRARIRDNLAFCESGNPLADLSDHAAAVFDLLTSQGTDYTEHLDLLERVSGRTHS